MTNIFDNYLKDIHINCVKSTDKSNCNTIKKKLETYLLDNLKEKDYKFDISSNISEDIFQTKWYKLQDTNLKLYNILKNIVNIEINSTAYMIKTISTSILSIIPDKTFIKINFNDDITNLSGIWDNDKIYFTLDKINDNSSKLILGLGPSASGKTFNAKNIIELLSKNDLSFPKTFITIDGGEYRKSSSLYSFIKKQFTDKKYAGLYELMSDDKKIAIFGAGSIKDKILEFLNQNINQNISLYVPETCSSNCIDKIENFIKITKSSNTNKWIALLIYQHKYGDECNFSEEYKCVGCTKSGIIREIDEGKKYSNKSWEKSMNNGIDIIDNIHEKLSEYDKFIIHNSGQKDKKSLLINLNDTDLSKFIDISKIKYLDKGFYEKNKDKIYTKSIKQSGGEQKYLKYKKKYLELKNK